MHPLKSHRVVCRIGAAFLASDRQARTAFEAAENEGWLAVTPTLGGALWLGGKNASLRADALRGEGNALDSGAA